MYMKKNYKDLVFSIINRSASLLIWIETQLACVHKVSALVNKNEFSNLMSGGISIPTENLGIVFRLKRK